MAKARRRKPARKPTRSPGRGGGTVAPLTALERKRSALRFRELAGAEIAGWYSNTLAPGQACIGQAAVLAALNAAAGAKCLATLECPSKCPCAYIPRQQLGSYTCQNGLEEGFLLQGTRVWNCQCLAQ